MVCASGGVARSAKEERIRNSLLQYVECCRSISEAAQYEADWTMKSKDLEFAIGDY